jgi:hypothetical protein
MSVHAWVRKNLAAYVAGGLNAASRGRLERHAAGCAECERALAEARSVDRELTALFADVRPGRALEEEAIRRLRQEPALPSWRRLSRKVKAVLAVATAVLLAAAGAGLSALIEEDRVGFPGETGSAPPDPQVAAVDGSLSMKGGTWGTDFDGRTEKSYFGILRDKGGGQSRGPTNPETLAAELRKKTKEHFAHLMHGTTDHGLNYFPDGTSNSAVMVDSSVRPNGSMGTDWELEGKSTLRGKGLGPFPWWCPTIVAGSLTLGLPFSLGQSRDT